jgi:hypothetical protein
MIGYSIQDFLFWEEKVNPIKLLFIIITSPAPNYCLLQVGNWWRACGIAWQALTSKWLRSIILHTMTFLFSLACLSYLVKLLFIIDILLWNAWAPMSLIQFIHITPKTVAIILLLIIASSFLRSSMIISVCYMVESKRNHLPLVTGPIRMTAIN